MRVALAWTAGSCIIVPVAAETEEERRSAALLHSTVFPTWTEAVKHCDRAGLKMMNDDAARAAAATEVRRVA